MKRYQPRLPREQFEALVVEALADLPPFFQERLDNVEVLITDWPSADDLDDADVDDGRYLLGLYHGIPLTVRTSGYQLVTPDTITLFQGPLELSVGPDLQRLREQIRRTVIHEFAHHFGISDDRLRQLGAY